MHIIMYNDDMFGLGMTIVYLLYGLSFFSMGLLVVIERGRCSEPRLKSALRPLAAFGLIHGSHEWFEMLLGLGLIPNEGNYAILWNAVKVGGLAFSFFTLTAFGVSLLEGNEKRRITFLVVYVQAALWGFGLLILKGSLVTTEEIWAVADVWTRYTVGIPGAIMAAAGLINQQRMFRRVGMERFGQDSLWAAVSIGWYGLVGQIFTQKSTLFPSTIINQQLFIDTFGFPVQVLRAVAAGVAAVFIVRFMRSFEVEIQQKIDALRTKALEEAQQRELQRGELLKKVVDAQEAERQRIARELHDETGQALTAIGLGLRGVTTTIPRNPKKAISNLEEMQSLVGSSLNELQRLILDLRPSHLDDLGLESAVRWYMGEVAKRANIEMDVDIQEIAEHLSTPVATAIFRVAQESITNVLKHADAEWVGMRLFSENGLINFEIRDNGKGFNQNSLSDSEIPSWGLLGMRERTSLLGGEFSINSSPGEGTEIIMNIPINSKADEKNENKSSVGR